MEEEVVNIKLAKLAKEKGFNIETRKIWANYYTGEPFQKWKILDRSQGTLSFMEWAAPTHSELHKWLRNNHNIDIQIIPNYSDYVDGILTTKKTYRVGIIYIFNDSIETFFIRPKYDKFNFIEFESYEDAMDNGLFESLQLITIS